MSPAKRARQEGPRPTLGGLSARYSWSAAAVIKPEVRRMTPPMRPPGGGAILAFACIRLSRDGARPAASPGETVNIRGIARVVPRAVSRLATRRANPLFSGPNPLTRTPRSPIRPHRRAPDSSGALLLFVRTARTGGLRGLINSATFGGLLHRRGRALPLANGRQKAWHSSRISRRRRASAGWC